MSAGWVPPTEAVEAARSAYWAAYSEAVRNAPSNRNGQGITATDGAAAGHAGHAAALVAARSVLVADVLMRVAAVINGEYHDSLSVEDALVDLLAEYADVEAAS